MIKKLGPPTLFVTLSAAESDWPDLHHVLSITDNGDTTPSRCPVHATLHFINRYHYLRNKVLKKDSVSGFGTLDNFFSSREFQKWMMLHIHDLYWTSMSI